jgi:DNA-binding transcriptional LysR family regulator
MNRSSIPTLNDLRAFETVARLGSVRAAATEISLTHGAVSRRITKLADDIEVCLFEPDGRGIKATKEGEILAAAVSQAFEIIGNALSEIRSTTDRQPIVLSCERSVAMRWLIPRLSNFQDANPELDLHLSVGGGGLDFSKERATIALRRLDFPIEPNWNVSILSDEAVGPVMLPDMLDKFNAHEYVALGSNTRTQAWVEWSANKPDAPKAKETRFFDHHFFMLESAASGLGVAMCPKIIALDYINDGRLIAPLGFIEDGSQYGLIYPKSLVLTPEIEVLIGWLKSISLEIYE